MARKILLAAIGFWFVFALVGKAAGADRAQADEPFEITADRILYEAEREIYVAEGNVHVLQAGRTLVARWVAYSKKTGIGVAEGDVVLVDGADRLNAAFMVFDVETLQGTLYQVALDSGGDGIRLRAAEMIRTGKNTFTVAEAVFSTCRCAPGKRLPWQIETKKADVEMGGYGKLKNSTFEVLGVPVLWVPWLLVPVKAERESGVMLPQFQFGGRGGAMVGVPLFLALPQVNLTATPRYYAQRGYKQDVELEYVFGDQSGGRLFVAGLYDHTKQATAAFNRRRWGLIWEHDHWLPGDLRWHTDMRVASDNLYADDFRELQRYKTWRFNESTSKIGRNFGATGGYGAMFAVRFADDLQGATKDDRDETLLQRLAEVRSDVQPGLVRGPFGFEARLDSEVIEFQPLRNPRYELEPAGAVAVPGPVKNDGRFYDLGFNGRFDNSVANGEGDGIFQPGEPLGERGTRVVLHPRLARPMRLGSLFELAPEVGYSQALYQSNAQRFAERGLATARVDLRARLARDYAYESGSQLRHVLEPKLGWAWVSEAVGGRGQEHNPLFIPNQGVLQSRFRALSLENVTRDPSDRIPNANVIVLGLTQKFFTKNNPRAVSQLSADLTTAIDWDFHDDGAVGSLYNELRLLHLGPLSSRLRGTFNPETHAFKEGEAELGVNWPIRNGIVRNVNFATRYRYLRRLPEFFESVRGIPGIVSAGDTVLNQIDLNARIELSARVRVSYRTFFNLAEQKLGFIRSQSMLEYVSKCRCWGVGAAMFQERRIGFGGGLMIRFLGLGDDDTDLFTGGFGSGLNF